MNTDFTWLQSLVPDVLKTARQRYLILEQIAMQAPVGRRVVAKKLGLSERNARTETDYLKQLGLISIDRSGMKPTRKGTRALQAAAPIIERLYQMTESERQLARQFHIDRVIIVPGDSDFQTRSFDLFGEELNSALDLLLPLGQSVITVLGGHTMARVALHLSPKLSTYRDLLFVPGRGAIGESADLQPNTIAQRMADSTHSKYRTLYLPEKVSQTAYRSLLRDQDIAQVMSDIAKSDAVIFGIGNAQMMMDRRGFSHQQKSELRQKGAVVECFGCFFNEAGELVGRIPGIGLQLPDLDKIPHVFAVAGGHRKALAIKSFMLHAPRQTWLITDEGASNLILKEK